MKIERSSCKGKAYQVLHLLQSAILSIQTSWTGATSDGLLVGNLSAFFFRYTAVQHLADKAKLLRKEAKGIQHMVMKDEVRIGICNFVKNLSIVMFIVARVTANIMSIVCRRKLRDHRLHDNDFPTGPKIG